MAQHKDYNRTAPIVREASMVYSWYLGSYDLVEQPNGVKLYEAIRINELGEMLLIAGIRPLNVEDGVLIDYLVSEWKQFTTYDGFDGEVEISLSKLLGLLEQDDTRHNRKKLKEQLITLEFTRIQVSKPSVADWYFRIFSDGIMFDSQRDKFKYRISKSFVEQLKGKGTRYISIEHLPVLKSVYAKELYRFLQVIGQGGKTQANHLGMKLNVSIKDAVQFLNLEDRIKSAKSRSVTLSKAFKEINDVVGTDYKCNRNANAYVRTNTESKKDVPVTVDVFDVEVHEEWFEPEPIVEVSFNDEVVSEPKPMIDIFKGMNGMWNTILSDGENMELGFDVNTEKYNVISNPYLYNEDGTEVVGDF